MNLLASIIYVVDNHKGDVDTIKQMIIDYIFAS